MTQPQIVRTGDARVDELLDLLEQALGRCDAIEGLQQAGIHICHSIEIIGAHRRKNRATGSGVSIDLQSPV